MRKCWPLGRFASLAARLTTAGFRLLVCLGPAETENAARRQQIVDAFPSAVLANNLTVDVLAGVIGRCAALVGNDSGVTHLAAALGVPTLALFGPTDPVRWAPQGRWVSSLRDPGWQAGSAADGAEAWCLQPSDVEQALKELLGAV
jgi:ADP-heptose:LPS heptosyltransferase